jgi:hypothetical protein
LNFTPPQRRRSRRRERGEGGGGAVRQDPVAFCRELLGFEPWSKQAEILVSIRDDTRTAVRS